MEGRQSGLAGGVKAEEYVAEQFRSFGLQPGGDEGSFYQDFPMLVTELRNAVVQIKDNPFAPVLLTLHEDYYPLTHSGSGYVQAEVVFVGHGISKPDKGWDDYGDTDVKGKIVLIFRGSPPVSGQDWGEEYSRTYTVNEAVRRGAKGILFQQGKRIVHGAAVVEEAYHPTIPMAYIAEHVVDKLLHGTGESLDSYRDGLKNKPFVLETGCRVRMDFLVERIVDGHTRNVVGILLGGDPARKDEYILVGAHVDHIGKSPGGQVFAGANDNASGTAVVLELARAFSKNPPARSLIFAGFAAEEQGLLGSEYLAQHLSIPKERLALMINYDMAGHGDGSVGVGGGDFFPGPWRSFMETVEEGLKEKIRPTRAWRGGSDQASFIDIDVPVFSIWSRGRHMFYHSVNDSLPWVKGEVIESVGQVSERIIRLFADWPHPLADGFSKERYLLNRGCQVDFSAAWREDGTALIAPQAPGFIQGALWTLVLGHESVPSAGGPRVTELFDCLACMKEIEKPGAKGKSFSDVRGIGSGHAFVYLPCLELDTYLGMGDKAWEYLKLLGLAFVVADGTAHLPRKAPEGIPLIIRLTGEPDSERALPEWVDEAIVVWQGEAVDLHAAIGPLAEGKGLVVITLPGEVKDPAGVKEAVEKLGVHRCHLDLTVMAGSAAGSEQEARLFGLVRALKEAGFDPEILGKLLGKNLMRWPKIEEN
jgi:hypothetical protein